jgi:lactobin A/cerein 7B family class IIb bacteriocin
MMKPLTIHTLVVAVALALWATPALAVMELSDQPVSSIEDRDTHSAVSPTSTIPLYALSRLDAQTLAAQEMTEQDLMEVEGGLVVIAIIAPLIALLLPAL